MASTALKEESHVRPRKGGTVRRFTQLRHPLKRLAVAACLAALSLAASASPAAASVTIGQLAPETPIDFCCRDHGRPAQPTVTSGNTYVVPGSRHDHLLEPQRQRPGAGQAVDDEGLPPGRRARQLPWSSATMALVPLTAGALNTFPASVPVKPGDVLGFNTATPTLATACVFAVPGDSYLFRDGNLADGESGDLRLLPPASA